MTKACLCGKQSVKTGFFCAYNKTINGADKQKKEGSFHMEQIEFDKMERVKICPSCKSEVPVKMEHAFKHEYCPFCGFGSHVKVEPSIWKVFIKDAKKGE